MQLQLELTFEGHIPSKKNNKRRVNRGGKTFMLPSLAHNAWHKREFLSLVRALPELEALARIHEPVVDFDPLWFDGQEGDVRLDALIKALRESPALYPAPYRIEYDYFPGSLQAWDTSNADESINDLFVDARLIEDDSWEYLPQRVPLITGFAPGNEHCVVRLYSLPLGGVHQVLATLRDKASIKALAAREGVTQKALRQRLEERLNEALAAGVRR